MGIQVRVAVCNQNVDRKFSAGVEGRIKTLGLGPFGNAEDIKLVPVSVFNGAERIIDLFLIERHINILKYWIYWLSSPHTDYSSIVRNVHYGGVVNYYNANYGNVGVRPALQIHLSSAKFTSSGTGTAKNSYVLQG